MQMRKLGPDGPEVSAIGVGAMSFTAFYGDVAETDCHATLDAAIECGITHLDTSNVYGMGRSEEIIGAHLDRYRAKGALPFRIATKAGIVRGRDSGPRKFDNSAPHLEQELDKSLKRLGLEQVELFYVHRRDPDIEIEDVTESLARLVQKGKIARFGFSEIAPTSLRRAAAVHPVAAVQSEYSLQTRLPDLGLVQTCAELGTALVAFSPVGRGLLTDRPPTPESIARSAFLSDNPRFTGKNLMRNRRASDALREIATDMGQPTAALAIAWLLQQGDRVIPIPGTHSPQHLRDLAAGTALDLTPDILAEIDRRLPVGWAHGDRYSVAQNNGPEKYC
ncbi:aldo/keto reductase [Marivita sp.]|uniref:aldo/keto reductase n=1 Tax=Marivita sp. TaxID=2003365 RepID=UPI0025C4BB84|nr:aldo/keto reductase [Marivita sp.]